MENENRSIVPMNVTLPHDSEKELNETLFYITMSMMKKLLSGGILSDDEFNKAEAHFARKYGILFVIKS